MRAKLMRATGLGWCSLVLVMLAGAECRALAGEMKLQAFLLWGTNEPKPPPGKNYRSVDLDVRQKLKDLPLKWTNWFEVNRKQFAAAEGKGDKVSISEKCQLIVRRIGSTEIEVTLIGKGKEVVKRKQALPNGEMLVLGGNAPNSTAWLVVLKRLE